MCCSSCDEIEAYEYFLTTSRDLVTIMAPRSQLYSVSLTATRVIITIILIIAPQRMKIVNEDEWEILSACMRAESYDCWRFIDRHWRK